MEGSLDGAPRLRGAVPGGKDLGLDMHTDDSDVTFNVCLGKAFAGAGLTFCGVLGGDAAQTTPSRVRARRPGGASRTWARTDTARTTSPAASD